MATFQRNQRKNKSKGNSNNNRVVTFNMPNPVTTICPNRTTVVLRFREYVGLASGANSYAYQTYSMNSAYDPLYTIGGGTCSGFVQWMSLYDRYYVSSMRISAQMYNASSNWVLIYLLPLRSADAVAGVTPTLDKIMESRDARYFNPQIGVHPSNGKVLSCTYTPYKFEGLPVNSNFDELSGDVTSDPTIQPAVQAGFISLGGTTQLTNSCLVQVEYSVTFWRPKLLGDV